MTTNCNQPRIDDGGKLTAADFTDRPRRESRSERAFALEESSLQDWHAPSRTKRRKPPTGRHVPRPPSGRLVARVLDSLLLSGGVIGLLWAAASWVGWFGIAP
jgi:ferric-dicitrate binding protein FerR (iron transport regulator)